MGDTTQDVKEIKIALKELESQVHSLTRDVVARQEHCDLKVRRIEQELDNKQGAVSTGTKVTILLAFLSSLATSVYNVSQLHSVSTATVERLNRMEIRQSGYNKLILDKLDSVREKPFTSDDGNKLKSDIQKDYIERFNHIWNQVHKQTDDINALSRK